MRTKELIISQYHASLEMLRQAVESCPVTMWDSSEYKNRFWRIAYHTIFYTHLYLHRSEDDFTPWEKHMRRYRSLGSSQTDDMPEGVYSKEEILDYLQLVQDQVEGHIDSLDLKSESGFYWLPFDKLELQIYNIRHIQHHTGELSERLGARGDIEVDWVVMKSDKQNA